MVARIQDDAAAAVSLLQNAYFSNPALNWIGRRCPVSKVSEYGLWQKGLEKVSPLTFDEVRVIEKLCREQ